MAPKRRRSRMPASSAWRRRRTLALRLQSAPRGRIRFPRDDGLDSRPGSCGTRREARSQLQRGPAPGSTLIPLPQPGHAGHSRVVQPDGPKPMPHSAVLDGIEWKRRRAADLILAWPAGSGQLAGLRAVASGRRCLARRSRPAFLRDTDGGGTYLEATERRSDRRGIRATSGPLLGTCQRPGAETATATDFRARKAAVQPRNTATIGKPELRPRLVGEARATGAGDDRLGAWVSRATGAGDDRLGAWVSRAPRALARPRRHRAAGDLLAAAPTSLEPPERRRQLPDRATATPRRWRQWPWPRNGTRRRRERPAGRRAF